MQISSPSQLKSRDPLSILLIGPPGGGKTTLAMQFPGVCFVDCDRNLDGPERFIRSKQASLSYGYVRATYKGETLLPIHAIYDNIMLELLALQKETEIKTLVLDGLTLVNEYIIQKILNEQKKSEMAVRDWQPFKSALLQLLVGRLRTVGKITIVTCHEDPIERPSATQPLVKEIIGYNPAIQGGIKDQFNGLFTDVWRCTAKPAAGLKVAYKLACRKDGQCDLKNSLGIGEDLIAQEGELMFEKLLPYLKGVL